ncbi:MAG: hypothetical protein LDL24_10065 [Treponema sp.]|nr:hypothetical protein [Treponema sp.]
MHRAPDMGGIIVKQNGPGKGGGEKAIGSGLRIKAAGRWAYRSAGGDTGAPPGGASKAAA